jgi:ABC-type transporter Mla MlaB component
MSFGGPVGLSRQMTANEETIVLVLSGPSTAPDILALCERVRELMEGSDADPVVCDVSALADPDVATVDVLARLQLTARQGGRRVRLRHACIELQELLALMGLSEVLPCGTVSGLEQRGQAEEREQARGVQEEADPGDPIV